MASLLQRLVQLGRTQLNDFLGQYWPGTSSSRAWETDSETSQHTYDNPFRSSSSFEEPASAGHGLPHSAELARCYRDLDLPFGAPMEQVTRQWKAYLRKCHPDRYAQNPAKQAEATILTQRLNDAHQKIKAAWDQYQR